MTLAQHRGDWHEKIEVYVQQRAESDSKYNVDGEGGKENTDGWFLWEGTWKNEESMTALWLSGWKMKSCYADSQ